MAAVESQQPGKPGTACLGCRRRKLKCSREPEGCVNCSKADLPCVYALPETGVKRKRGPYNKVKQPRERHLEHLVKYLEPRGLASPIVGGGRKYDPASRDTVTKQTVSSPGFVPPGDSGTQSENLVKDALIALTKSSVNDRESTTEHLSNAMPVLNAQPDKAGPGFPTARRTFEYWHLFTSRVDPITKVIHCPSMMQQLVTATNHPVVSGSAAETLIYSIFYIAVSTCTANEARRRFGESRRELLHRYERVIESALADTSSMPSLENVQALVLYIIGIRRQDDGTSVSTLFALVFRMAQMIGLHKDPGPHIRPFEAELQEGNARSKSIQEGRDVQFPANLNDQDLDPHAAEAPQARKGQTEMSWVLMRWEIQHLSYRIAAVRKQASPDGQLPNATATMARQRRILEESQVRFETQYVQHLHKSRPLDLMALAHYECIILKIRMAVEYPGAHSQMASNGSDLSSTERSQVLQDSVAIISITHMLTVDRRIAPWQWFIRGYMQWHSLAIVVAELGRIRNKDFTHSAWAVLDPILTDWDRMYLHKKGEAAWDHVNAMISRARQMRHQPDVLLPSTASAHPPTDYHGSTLSSVAPSRQFSYSGPQHTPQSASPSSSHQIAEPLLRPSVTPQQVPTPQSPHIVHTAHAASAQPPLTWEYDMGFEAFDDLGHIDFEAFDAVFGGDGWEFQSPLQQDLVGTPLELDPRMKAP
ncbi:hypothetical protein LTR53_005651 [Teratosphaeriaceae sp. CCFEE 6253]|nr:hypothetical protein LTR53_005651 [Teratosphaeriaceae sp. CCFEE 6253]